MEAKTDRISRAEIQIQETSKAIQRLIIGKSDGYGEIDAAISKCNIDWIAPIVTQMFNNSARSNAMPKEWIRGAITFRNKNAPADLNNYRPIALINMIYKIGETVTTQRLNPLINLLTAESQYVYKSEK